MKHQGILSQPLRTSAAVAAAVLSFSAHAVEFETDDGTRIVWNTTIGLGTAVRAANADPKLLHWNNAAQHGILGATGGNTDDGNLNYKKGDTFSTLLKVVSDVEVKRDNLGGLVRVKAWTDHALERNNVIHGSTNNRYQANAPLKDDNFENLAKFSGVALLDAYVYGNFTPAIGDLRVAAGRHVLNWGESLFLQGLNQISPIDVGALRKPGAEVREALLPVGMVSASLGVGRGVSVDGFVQLQRATSVADGCGTYFLGIDGSVGPNAQNACNTTLVSASNGAGDAFGLANNVFVPLTATAKARNTGQFGVAVRFPVQAIDTEIGLYAMNIDSRVPILSMIKGNSAYKATTVGARSQSSVFWEYPSNIHIFGASAATTLGGWAVGTELSVTPNLPVQLAAGDIAGAVVFGSSVLPGAQNALVPLLNTRAGPLGGRFAAAANGDVVAGYDRARRIQLQMNAIQGFSGVLGASTLMVAGEVGMQWANIPNNYDGVRYGRSFVFGIADSPSYRLSTLNAALTGALGAAGTALTANGVCPVSNTTGTTANDGCANDGFATPFSWGYRVRGQLTYADAFNLGVTLKPTLSLSGDQKGYSVDGMFNKGRRVTGVSLGIEYAKRYTAEIGYVTYNRSAKWDAMRDRDYYHASISMAF